VPLLAVLRPYLKDAAGSPELIFGRGPDQPFDPKTVGDRAKRSWHQANQSEGKKGELRQALRPMTLHECRHTFASLLIDAGVNPKAIQEFMGHATIEETLSRYGHLMPGARDQARKLVDAYMQEARGLSATKALSGGKDRGQLGAETIALWRYPRKREHAGKSS
jgi:integrase